jgi:hypothetical protein
LDVVDIKWVERQANMECRFGEADTTQLGRNLLREYLQDLAMDEALFAIISNKYKKINPDIAATAKELSTLTIREYWKIANELEEIDYEPEI